MRFIPSLTTLGLATLLAAGAGAADQEKARSPRSDKAAASTPAEKGRDWARIDVNKDGFVSPDEMDAWLKANPGPQR